jgi:hypothetical protein
MTDGRISLRAAVHPPVRLVGEPGKEAAALVELAAEGEGTSPPVHVVVVRAGDGDARRMRTALAALLAAAGPDDRVLLPDGTALEGGKSASTAAEAGVEAPAPTLAAALRAGRAALDSVANGPRVPRILVATAAPFDEEVDALIEAVGALAEARIGVDFFVDADGPDLGALSRMAAATGGDLLVLADAPDRLPGEMGARLALLRRLRAPAARLALTFASGVEPTALFRLRPGPVWLGNIHFEAGDRTVVLEPGPVAPGRSPAWVVTLNVPARRTGLWRLVEARLLEDQAVRGRAPALLRVTDEQTVAGWVAPQVVAARDVCDLAAWLEEVAQAAPEGDHRRVASLLERLQHRFVELDRRAAVAVTVAMRQRFLRSGMVDPAELDRLRGLAPT